MSEDTTAYVTIRGRDRSVKAFRKMHTPRLDPKRQYWLYDSWQQIAPESPQARAHCPRADRRWPQDILDYNALTGGRESQPTCVQVVGSGKRFLRYMIDDRAGRVIDWVTHVSVMFANLRFEVLEDEGSGSEWVHYWGIAQGRRDYTYLTPDVGARM